MSRSSVALALAVLTVAPLSACGASPPPQVRRIDERTNPETATTISVFAAMPRLADTAVAYQTRRQRGAAPPAAVANQLRSSARKAFDPALLAAQLPPPVADDPAFVRALAHYEVAVTKLSAMAGADEAMMRRDAQAADTRFSARSDRAAIESLVEIMPEPERVREQGVTLRRMLQALGTVHGGIASDLRAADINKLKEGVDQMLADTRRGRTDYGDALPTLDVQVEAAQGAVRRALIELSSADVAALFAAQKSPSSRAHGQLLKAALEAANDQAGRAMLIDLFTRVKNLPTGPG